MRPTVPVRYEKTAPGELVHVDIKKQGRIPDGGGWRAHGRGSAHAKTGRAAVRPRGYRYLHHAVDDYSRVAWSPQPGTSLRMA